MNDPIISVIVPVYNVESYLRECIDSIVFQEYENMEIILVDDGSKDESGEICDEYAANNKNVLVIHQENAGLAAARNAGTHSAKGDYLLFVDSDDYIADDVIGKIVRESMYTTERPDIIFLKAKKVFPDGSEKFFGESYDKKKIDFQPKDDVLKHLVTIGKFPGSSCNKMVKRDLIVKNNITFPEKFIAEDIDWVLLVLEAADSFFYCDKDYYYYRQKREGSITNTIDEKSLTSLLSILEKWIIRSNNEAKDYHDIFNAFLAYEYMVLLCAYGTLAVCKKRDIKQRIHDCKGVMEYAEGRKEKITAFAIRLLGIEVTAWFLAKYNALRS